MASLDSSLLRTITGNGLGFLDVKFPGFSITGGFETSSVQSLGEMATSVVSSAQNLIQAGKLAYCVGKMIANPTMALGVLETLGNNILAAAAQIAGRLASLIKGQITAAMGQIIGSVTNLVGSLFGFLGSIADFVKAIKDFIEAISNLGLGDWDDFMAEEDCEYIFATIAACMLNKLLGNKLQELENKLSSEIIEAGDKMNSAIADQLSDVNSVSSYLERERFMMEKATKQINGINNLFV